MSALKPIQEILLNKASFKDRPFHSEISAASNKLAANVPKPDDFRSFLNSGIYDVMVNDNDSAMRSSIMRVLRLSMLTEENCKLIVEMEFHWPVITSLEREGDYASERMQALKLMEQYLKVSPSTFPISFARSLVAICNSKDDAFRKLCLEMLRSIAMMNPQVVAFANGFASLMESIIEPITQEMADNILLTILFLLNDPQSRAHVRPFVDLRSLVRR